MSGKTGRGRSNGEKFLLYFFRNVPLMQEAAAMLKKIALTLAAVIVIIILFFFLAAPRLFDTIANGVYPIPAAAASKEARDLYATLLVADLHCDALMSSRDLLDRSGRGHVDIPRLIEGNVALQTFSAVTRAPAGIFKWDNVRDENDLMTPLVIAQLWPPRTWTSTLERALYQAEKMREFAGRSNGTCSLITSREGLAAYRARRAKDPHITAALLSIEGAQALEGDVANLDRLYAAGFRMISPTHFFDNEMAGSAHGVTKGGLTEKGKRMIALMQEKGMIVDLAHASPKTIDDVLAMTKRPVIVSHTGVRGACDTVRNLTDAQIKAIARTGGVIGMTYFEYANCGEGIGKIARSFRYARDRVGAGHLALGSDFDGAVMEPFDTTGLVMLADALLKEGFTPEEVRLVMGENVFRVLGDLLPAK
jgi:membrane dipeptidase